MQTSAKVFLLFAKTFYYFLLSHFPGQDVRVLKQKWAAAIMRDFGYRVTVSGTAPLPKPLILVGNHISYLDIMLLMSVHPDIVFVAKKEVAGWPIIGPAAARVGTVFVDRAAKNDGGKKRSQVAEALKKNNTQVVVFPSGTTSLIDRRPRRSPAARPSLQE